MRRILHPLLLACCGALLMAACRGAQSTPPPDGRLTIGIAFETLQTEFWVAAWSAFKSRGEAAGATLLQAVADGDANKQFEQVRSFISRRVNGIVIVPKDGKTVIPMIRAANAASIPVVLFNRPADATDARHTVVAPDNAAITRDTVAYLIDTARRAGTPVKAAVLLGDLSDVNAVGRRDGFEQAVTAAGGAVSVVARIPTEWNQEKALAGLQSAFQSEPGIGLIFLVLRLHVPERALRPDERRPLEEGRRARARRRWRLRRRSHRLSADDRGLCRCDGGPGRVLGGRPIPEGDPGRVARHAAGGAHRRSGIRDHAADARPARRSDVGGAHREAQIVSGPAPAALGTARRGCGRRSCSTAWRFWCSPPWRMASPPRATC